MPVTVIAHGFINSHGISQSQLANMWEHFHQSPSGGIGNDGVKQPTTQFAHFPIKNILELLMVNRIVSPSTSIGEAANIVNYAIRVFFAQHVDHTDCPVATANNFDYIGRNTVVLVNARYLGDEKWENMISDNPENPDSVEVTGYSINTIDPSQGSDRTNLCPPQCS